MSGAKAETAEAGRAPGRGTSEDPAVVVECDLGASPAKVFRAIAEPSIRTEWLGEAEAGPSEVRRAEPPARLDLAWPTYEGESLISFEIRPAEDGGSHLTITHYPPLAARVVQFTPRNRAVSRARPWRMAA